MKKSIFIFVMISLELSAQSISSTEYFPDDLTIRPFTANTLEPRLGFLFKTGSNDLQLDIGNTIDMVRMKKDGNSYSIGADLFTWTKLRREDNFRFPVDAVDYLFGLNFGYKKTVHDYSFGVRFRLSHISAHFVDGHYDNENTQWRNGLNPGIYSREFIELIAFYEFRKFRVYSGVNYLFHVEPSVIKKDNYQIGFDYYLKNILWDYFTPFIAYDLKLIHLSKYTGNNSITAGIKFGNIGRKGLSVSYNYYSGYSIYGEYFDSLESYSSIRISLDL